MDRRGWQKLGRLSGVASFAVVVGSVLWASGCSDSDSDCDGFGCSGSGGGNGGGTLDAGKSDTGTGVDSGKDAGTPPVCHYPSDCPDGKACVEGQCLPRCTGDAGNQCGNGYKCDNGVCQPDPGQPQCKEDKDCPASTPKCRGGRCVQACDPANDKCPDGTYCDPSGACVPDTRPDPPICTDKDMSACMSNQTCIDGHCRYRCEDDDTCRLIDGRIAWCGVDKVCRSKKEAHPACTQPGQCTSPQVCVDNTCQ